MTITEYTNSQGLQQDGDCKELLKFRQRKLTAEAGSSESDLGFSTIDAPFHTRGNLDLILIYGRKQISTRQLIVTVYSKVLDLTRAAVSTLGRLTEIKLGTHWESTNSSIRQNTPN